MSRIIDKKWLYKYYNSQDNDTHRMYEGGGFREYKQIRRLAVISELIAPWNLKGTYVLDVGCGDGHAASLLLKGSDFVYVGFDYSQHKLKAMCMRNHNSSVMVGDAENIPLADESVDYILCLETLEHLLEPAASISEMARVLKSNGTCLISVPVNSLVQPSVKRIIRKVKGSSIFDEHIQTVTARTIRSTLEQSGFHILAVKYCGFNIPVLNILLNYASYSFFEKVDKLLSTIPLCYTGAGIHAGISLGMGNEYLIVAAQKTGTKRINKNERLG